MSLRFDKGREYRLANRDAVEKGQYYIAAACKGCRKLIHALKAGGHPSGSTPFSGEGEISMPCRRCGTDARYTVSDFSVRIATESQPATYERVKASTMPRQKLLKTKSRDAKPTFGTHVLEDRPKAATLIARIIGISSEIDAVLADLLGRLMKADTPAAMALFLSLRKSSVSQDALNAVANVALTDEGDLELCKALMLLKRSSDKERDALAHGRFGESIEIPDGVVWVDSFDYMQFSLRVEMEGLTDDATKWLRERMFLYELADLQRIADDGEALYNSVRSFTGYLRSDDPAWRAIRYPQLCAEPHIQQALHQIREGKKNSPESQTK